MTIDVSESEFSNRLSHDCGWYSDSWVSCLRLHLEKLIRSRSHFLFDSCSVFPVKAPRTSPHGVEQI
jgi:hypothetical protein